MKIKPRLAIVTTSNDKVSDTFIKAHLQQLDAETHGFYGLPMPIHAMDGTVITANLSGWKRLLPAFIYDRMRARVQDPESIIASLFQLKKIEIVLAEYGTMACKVDPICRRLGIPLIVHFHGFDASRKTILDAFEKKYKTMFQYASSIVSVSHSMTKQLIKLGAPSEKIVYNPCGPSDKFFSLQPAFQPHSHFLFVGRFVEKKAPHLTLLAFQKTQESIPDARLIMIGDGPLLPTCRQLADSLAIQGVDFKGAVPHHEAQQYFETACCLIQHSVIASDGDSEGTPVAILEAGAAGLPVVSTRHAGIPDVVVEGHTGFLVAENDVNGMAMRMIQLWEDHALCRKIGQQARQHVAENFSIKKHLHILDTLVQQTLQHKK